MWNRSGQGGNWRCTRRIRESYRLRKSGYRVKYKREREK